MQHTDQERLIGRLRRIESLFADRAATAGERAAAGEARERIRQQQYLTEETNRVIAESINKDTSDVEVRSGQALPATTTLDASAESKLAELIKHDEAPVMFVSLGPAEGRGDRVMTALGLPYTKLEAPCDVV